MRIRLKKGRDGPDSLACVRDDGTSTWRRIQRGLALHDLAHYAVERETGAREGFFGLVAKGWSMEAFEDAEERRRIPPEALWVELVVNAFLVEAAAGERLDARAFHAGLEASAAKLGATIPRALADDEIARIRFAIADAVGRWRALELGGTLELPFP